MPYLDRLIKFVVCLTLLFTFGSQIAAQAYAAPKQVKVHIPTFNVELNGVMIDNEHQEYPLLVYNDITYFPMTWNYSRALSLSVNWDQESGLSIMRNNQFREKMKQTLGSNNDLNRDYTATVADYPIHVNWKQIDNANESYPVLQFRDITYFPMTWRFTHDEFEWDTSWMSKAGFKLTTIQHKVLYQLFYEEGDFLYAYGNQNDVYQINKSLEGTPIRLAKEAGEEISKHEKDRFKPYQAANFEKKNEKVELKDHTIEYKQLELLSFSSGTADKQESKSASVSLNKKVFSAESAIIPVSNDITFVFLTVYYAAQDIYTPQDSFAFIVKDGKAVRVPEFNQKPDYVINNKDGSSWLISQAPSSSSARTARLRGQILHIAPDGATTSMNNQMQADNLDLLFADQGVLTVRAYSEKQIKETDGIYLLNGTAPATKLHDYVPGNFYIDASHTLYVVDGMKNRITNLTNNTSKYWWDYELMTQLY
ncbi:hypothetical protein SAMN03159341_108150 [Paenibacillus sp. 1_12]|uniref:hypothetical protein n=1 Tax=Paenibacillus sp. 1_12 TaxID=1566278 RepID=UPI0008F40D05|nr:hypothetical protein [Paenibacillus sp. 1_12]SFL67050.1 hypothetical protein SAMN03159341_108150 [Paenibacillus sp. 1_12]